MKQEKREKDFYIFRHGETDHNREGKIQGQLNTYLNLQGRKQAQTLGDNLKNCGIEVIVSSDLDRAVETANIVAQEIGVPVFTTPELREVNLGAFEGYAITHIIDTMGEEFWDQWLDNKIEYDEKKFPEGESKIEVRKRVMAFIEKFLNENSYKTVAFSTHGFVVNQILVSLRNERNFNFAVPNGSFFSAKYKEGRFLICNEEKEL